MNTAPARHAPFAIFGLPAVYDIDKRLLRHRYLALQRRLHPDGPVSRADVPPLGQPGLTADSVNTAFMTLNSDVRRANCLCTAAAASADDLQEYLRYGERRQRILDTNDEKQLEQLVADTAALRDRYLDQFGTHYGSAEGRGRAERALGLANFYEQQREQLRQVIIDKHL